MKKLILYIIMLTMLLPFVFSLKSLEYGHTFYYGLDNNFLDYYGVNNGTGQGGVGFSTVKVRGTHSTNFVPASSQYIDTGKTLSGDYTLSLWINPDDVSNQRAFAGSLNIVGTAGIQFGFPVSGTGYIDVFDSGMTPQIITFNKQIPITKFTHIVLTYDGYKNRLYINGTFINSSIGTSNNPTSLRIGRTGLYDGFYYDGLIDEVGVWNRSFNQEEITKLYNNNDSQYPWNVSTQILIDITLPLNNTKVKTDILINYTLVDVNVSAECNYFINSSLISKRTGLKNGTFNVSFNSTHWLNNDNLINISCNDTHTSSFEQINLFVDATLPEILYVNKTIGGVSTFLNNSNIYIEYFVVNIATNDTNNYFINFTLEGPSGIVVSNQTTDINYSYYVLNTSVNLSTFNVGEYNYTIVSSDAHTKNKIDYSKYLYEQPYNKLGNKGVSFDNKIHTYIDSTKIISFITDQKEDRKEFTINFILNVSKFDIYIEADKSINYVGEKYGYQGHFIIDNFYWYDLENEYKVKVVAVTRVTDLLYKVTMQKNSNVNTVTFNSIGIINTITQTGTFTYFASELNDCTRGTPTINFTIKNESDNSLIAGTIEHSFTYNTWTDNGSIYSTNYSDSVSSNSSQICIFPNATSLLTNFQVQYDIGGTKYSYFGIDVNLSNVTRYINLYVVDGTTQVLFNVRDTNDDYIQDALIHIDKYYVGTNTYKTVEVLSTDSQGNAVGNIVLNTEYYRFTIVYDGVTRLVDGPTILVATTRNFVIDLTGGDWFNNYDTVLGVSYSLTFTNATLNYNFQYSDPSSSITKACLKVEQLNVTGNKLINDTCLTTYTGNILNNIEADGVNNRRYLGTAYVTVNGQNYTLDVLEQNYLTEWEFYDDKDHYGVFVTLILMMALILLGIFSPMGAVILGVLSLIVINMLGLFHLSWPTLITLAVIGGIAIYKINRSQ